MEQEKISLEIINVTMEGGRQQQLQVELRNKKN